MAYNEKLAQKIREALHGIRNVHEKRMFGGIAFMVNDKMCVGVDKNDLMVRCSPDMTETLLSRKGVRIFDLTGKPMKGWLLVNAEGIRSKKDFDFWVSLAVEANKEIIRTKKK
jgi:TfoX/Sxy family transcriptional regulator of competence genes